MRDIRGLAASLVKGTTAPHSVPLRSHPNPSEAQQSIVAGFPGKVRTLHVAPALPAALSGLRTIAQNWRHTWNATARGLFRRLDPALWKSVRQDPMLFLARVEQETLRSAESDPGFLGLLHAAMEDARRDQVAPAIALPESERDLLVAYFCAEFAIAEYFQIYSGGLGVLAGDHLRSASDLRLPFVAVGLFRCV